MTDTPDTAATTAPRSLTALLSGPRPGDAEIAAALGRQPLPLAEPGRVTFAFLGPADAVELVRWIHAGIDRDPFTRVPGTDLWLLTLTVPDRGRFEYKLALHRDGGEEWILDPLNPERAVDPFGENSVCRTHGYIRPDWTLPQGAPAGETTVLPVESAVFGTTREEVIYRPAAEPPAGGYPLVVFHDGHDFDTYADLSVILDNLIAAGDVPPLAAVLIQTHDRTDEYPRGRRHARYVATELLPAIDARLPVSDDPGARVLLGASLGAVASLSTAFRYPGLFGGLVLKSGSFILDETALETRPNPVFHRVARLVRAVRRTTTTPATRAFVSTGELEGLAAENVALAEMLRGQGVDVLLKTSWDGHHWHNWRDQLRDALMWVFAGRNAAP